MKKLTKKILSVFLAMLMLISTLSTTISAFAYTTIQFNTSTYCYVSTSSYTYFEFVAPTSGEYTIYADSSSFDTYGELYNSNFDFIDDDDDSNGNSNFKIVCDLDAGKKYYVKVSGYNGASGYCYITVKTPAGITNIFDINVGSSYTYTGTPITPKPTVYYNGKLLYEDMDYYVSYDNNTNAGTATVYVTGMGSYSGTQGVNFTISKKAVSSCTVSLSKTSYTYSGSQCKPSVTVKIGGNTISTSNYSVAYSSNKNAGTAKVTVTGKGSLTGTKTLSFTIAKKKVTSVVMNNQGYDGKKKAPAVYHYVNVKEWCDDCEDYHTYQELKAFKKGTDYTMKVSGNATSIGTYTATIKFKGNYSGTVKKTFKINPASVKNLKTSKRTTESAYYSWSKVKGATGYKIYRWNFSKSKYELYKTQSKTGITVKRKAASDSSIYIYVVAYKKVGKKTYYSGTKNYRYTSLKPGQATIKLENTDFGRFNVNFGSYDRYQVQISYNKNFNPVLKTWEGYGSSMYWYNAKSGKRYYVRARKYQYVNGKLEVGKWSKVKSIVPW